MNPYEPMLRSDATNPPRVKRAVWLVVFTAAFGIAFTTFALLIVVETLGIADRQGNWNAELIKGATASAVIGLFGGCWFCATILYWNRRKKIATRVNLATFGATVLFAVLVARGDIL